MSKAPIFVPEEEDFSMYIERLEFYFKIESTDDDLKKSVLCVNLQPSIYADLKSLLSPIEFTKATYKQCTDALSKKYTKVKKVISERYSFNLRKQRVGESITDYISAIKSLAASCNFGSFFDNALRDRLVSGLLNTNMVSRLLSEADTMTFDDACKIIFDMEAVEKSTNIISGNDVTAHIATQSPRHQSTSQSGRPNQRSRAPSPSFSYKSRSSSAGSQRYHRSGQRTPSRNRSPSPHRRPDLPNGRKTCHYCYKRHNPRNCPAKKWICHNCGRQGHVAGFCYNANFVNMYNSCNVSNPLSVNIQVNGTPTNWLVDTGSAVSIVSADLAKSLKLTKLSPFLGFIRGVNGQQLNILGTCQVEVKAHNQSKKHLLSVIVAAQLSCPAILGRDWLSVLSPNWSANLLSECLSNTNDFPVNCTVSPNEKCQPVAKCETDMLVETLPKRFPSVFSKGNNDLPIKDFKVSINLKDNVQPIFHKAYTVPYALRDEVSQELSRLESEGIISKVNHADWGSPMVCVPKSNGKLRICVDFKATLNKYLKVDQHPIPNPDDIFNKFVGCNVFCRLDLSQAYLQLEVHETSKPLLVVNTIKGLYMYNRLPFGLASACAIFQSVIESILTGLDHVAPYLDDILIGGKDLSQCQQNLEDVLSRLEKYNVKLNVEKSEFFVQSLVFLGFELSGKGKAPSATKVQQILSIPAPTNLTELKSFVSMFNYYRNFVHMCPDLLEPFHKLMRKDEPFVWSSECALAFAKCKTALSEATMLVLFDPSKELILSVDSSSFGVGAVLSQIDGNKEYPLAFESATLNPAQRNYSQLEKEALAVIFGLKKFHKYLWGRNFTICSDHLPLKSIFGEKKRIPSLASSKLIRWAIILSAYQYKIVHRKGSLIPHADAMSRLPSSSHVPDEDSFFTYLSTPLVSNDEVCKETMKDKVLCKVLEYVQNGFPRKISGEFKVFSNNSHCLSVHNGCLFFGSRIVIPESLRSQVLDVIHFSHAGITRSKLFARSYVWWPSLDNDLYRFVSNCKICQSHQNKRTNQYRLPWPKSKCPWERVHLDLFDFHNNKYLIVCDSYSKWIECFVLRNKSDFKAVINKLAEVFSRFSFPKTIVCDNGPPFCSKDMKDFCERKSIKLMFTPPYSPQSNGLAERSVQTFKTILSKFYLSHRNLNLPPEQMLLDCLYAYRTTPSTVTGKSPMAMLLTFEPKTPLSHLKKNVSFKLSTNKQKVDQSNRPKKNEGKIPNYNVNQLVWVCLNKKVKENVKYVVGQVVKKFSKTVYLVKVSSDIHKVHVNQLRFYYIHKPSNSIHSSSPVKSKTPSPKPTSPVDRNANQNAPRSPVISSPRLSPSITQSPQSPNRQTSSRGRVIKPTKRFTFSEFD